MTTINLTPRELEIMTAVIAIDWPKVAVVAKVTTAKQARDKWGGIKKKLTADAPASANDGDGGDGSPAGKGGGKKRKGDDEEATSTPKKKPTLRKGKKDTPAPTVADDEDDEEGDVKAEPDTVDEF